MRAVSTDHDWLTNTRASYDTVAASYADRVRKALAGQPYLRAALALFADSVRELGGGPVADIGCGPGYITAYLHKLDVAVEDRGLRRSSDEGPHPPPPAGPNHHLAPERRIRGRGPAPAHPERSSNTSLSIRAPSIPLVCLQCTPTPPHNQRHQTPCTAIDIPRKCSRELPAYQTAGTSYTDTVSPSCGPHAWR